MKWIVLIVSCWLQILVWELVCIDRYGFDVCCIRVFYKNTLVTIMANDEGEYMLYVHI